jgi:uncharacterized protein (TIGR03437 family)
VSDFNGDGVPDLLFPSDNSLNREAPVAIVTGLGGGAFGDTSYGFPLPPLPSSSLRAYQALAADFNSDGRPDIAEFVSDGTVQFLMANQEASGKLTATPASFSVQTVWPSDFHKSFTVNLTYQTTEAISTMFEAGLSSEATLTASLPSAGQLLLSSADGGVYTYTAHFDVVLSAGSETGFHSASLLFRVGDSKASIPVSLIGNTSSANGSAPAITGVFNAAAGGQAINGVVAEGSYIAIYGTGLAGTGNSPASALPLPITLNSSSLKWTSPAHLLYASPTQVNALVPQDLFTYSQLLTFTGPSASLPVNLSLVELQPGIYTQDTSGSGPGVIANAFTGQLIDSGHPARAGDYVVVYCTGLGRVTGPNGETAPADGAAAPLDTIYHTAAQVTATIGGVNARVVFSGLTPGFAGLYQVNIQIPPGVPAGAVPMILKAENSTRGSIANSNLVTIQLQ